MSNSLQPFTVSEAPQQSNEVEDIPGTITNLIGSGKHAQASISWYSILLSFCAGGVATILVFSLSVFYPENMNFLDGIKAVWAIFVPIITLSLGYIFGKQG